MNKTIWHCHIAMSLDGKIARADGSFDWLEAGRPWHDRAGKLDVLEMAIIPVVLGDGIPLFPAGTRELGLRLVKCEPRSQGALHVVYEAAC